MQYPRVVITQCGDQIATLVVTKLANIFASIFNKLRPPGGIVINLFDPVTISNTHRWCLTINTQLTVDHPITGIDPSGMAGGGAELSGGGISIGRHPAHTIHIGGFLPHRIVQLITVSPIFILAGQQTILIVVDKMLGAKPVGICRHPLGNTDQTTVLVKHLCGHQPIGVGHRHRL